MQSSFWDKQFLAIGAPLDAELKAARNVLALPFR
jgi:hypothetical protein